MVFEKDGKKLNLLNEYLFPKIFGENGCEDETLHLINTFTGKNFTDVYYIPKDSKFNGKGDQHDKSVNKMYEKTLDVLQDQKEYLAYIRVEQAELDYKAR